MRRIFSLCFSEITLETSRNDARIFERNFVESSQGQRTKFAHFALITFSQCNSYVYLHLIAFNFLSNLPALTVSVDRDAFSCCCADLSRVPELPTSNNTLYHGPS